MFFFSDLIYDHNVCFFKCKRKKLQHIERLEKLNKYVQYIEFESLKKLNDCICD